jgi:Arc/MetJ-type ribon-helix-helix transcriptional regulator
MESPLTLRLDKHTRERLARIAREKRITASEVVRAAIDAWVQNHEAAAIPYENASDLIGIVHGGKPDRSSESGQQFKNLLKARRGKP